MQTHFSNQAVQIGRTTIIPRTWGWLRRPFALLSLGRTHILLCVGPFCAEFPCPCMGCRQR